MTTEITLKDANRLFREGRYAQALQAYEALQQRDGAFSVYAENAEAARRRLAGLDGLPELADDAGPGPAGAPADAGGAPAVTVHFLQVQPLALALPQMLDKLCFYVQALGARLAGVHAYLDAATLAQADSLAGSTLPALARLRSRLHLHPSERFSQAAAPAADAPAILYVFDMQVLSDASRPHHARIREFQKAGTAWRIHDEIQHHGSFYLKSLESYFDPAPAQARLQARLQQLRRHPHADRAVVAGTGPALKYVYALEELDRSLVITCNSALYNRTLMHTLRPHIVCATDPIFHAGWGQYASEFRSALLQRLDEFDFMIVVPTRDYHVYLDFLPERLHDRIGCYALDGSLEAFNLDLVERPVAKSTPNVLTNIMLPLAATLSRQISVVGCDGKKESSGYFWAHDPSSQINKHMGDIQKEFKGFFDIDYDKYYVDHCNTLDALLTAVEARGAQVRSRTPSWIPTLARRADLPPGVARVAAQQVDVSVIMPARDAAATLDATCASVDRAASRAGVRARLIVIDDASIDDTAHRARAFGERAAACEVLVVPTKGLGVAGARNVGLGFVNSRYTGFLDADDFYSEDSLAARIQVLETARAQDATVVGAFSRTRLVDMHTQAELSVANNFRNAGRRYRFRDVSNPAHISSILYRSEAVEAVRFDHGRHYGEDWLFLAQVLAKGGELVFDADSHTVYSINPESATKRNPHLHVLALFDVLQILYTGQGLEAAADAPAARGLNGLGVTPTLADKKAELLARLVGTLLVQRQFPNARALLAEMIEGEVIEPGVLAQLARRPDHHAAIVRREVARFAPAGAGAVAERLMHGIDAMRLADLLPQLHRALTTPVVAPAVEAAAPAQAATAAA